MPRFDPAELGAWATVIGTAITVLVLAYRVGKLAGVVEATLNAGHDVNERQDRDIAQVAAALDRHEAWHAGPGPERGRRR